MATARPGTNVQDPKAAAKIRDEVKAGLSSFRKDFLEGKLVGSTVGHGEAVWTTLLANALTLKQYQGLLDGTVRIFIFHWVGWTVSPSPKSQKDSFESCTWLQALGSPSNFTTSALVWHLCD
jgi:hypothetical protein